MLHCTHSPLSLTTFHDRLFILSSFSKHFHAYVAIKATLMSVQHTSIISHFYTVSTAVVKERHREPRVPILSEIFLEIYHKWVRVEILFCVLLGNSFISTWFNTYICLQYFDTVGWVSERASGLQKIE